MDRRYFPRFWSIPDKEFITWQCYMQTACNRGIKEKPYGLLYELMAGSKDIIACRSTGLKDKNGKMIYEGDIIVIPNQYPFYTYKNEADKDQSLNETHGEIRGESILNYIGIVEDIFNCWQYVYHCVNPAKRGMSEGINNTLNDCGFDEDENSIYEIIGNIYENPELIKDFKR